MASTVTGVIGWGVSDGETIDSTSTRWSTLSSFDVVGGASPLLNVGGILPTSGNPLGVTQAGTPAMKVTLVAGRVAVPANTGSVPPFGLTLSTNTDLDIAAANATNPRIDLVIAKIYSDGTSASTGTFEILTGTPGAVPSRPTLPSGNYHCISLATVTVPANATSIVNANITKTLSDTWTTATSDARYTAAPGGCVFQGGLMTMSTARRQAWAATYSPATMWWDQTNRCYGVTNGSDIVPLNPRKLYQVENASTVQTTSTTPVTIATAGTLTVFGGNRRIRVTASGEIGTDRNDVAGWIAARVYLSGSGVVTVPSTARCHVRVFGQSASASTVSQASFHMSYVWEVAPGSLTINLAGLRVTAGGSGTGDNAIFSEGCLLVEDIGPA